MKKFVSLLLAMMMVIAMAAGAMAEENPKPYTITINNKIDGHTYEAYQIFKGNIAKDAENDSVADTKAVLSNVEWGNGVTYTGEGVDVDGVKSTAAADIAYALANKELTLAELLDDLTLTNVAATSTDAGDVYTISGLEAGYYLVKDQDGSLGGTHDAYTNFIIEVVENSTVNPKSSVPSVEKKVDDVNDSNNSENEVEWEDSADYDIDDAVPFQLKATLANNVSTYKTYKVVFHDTLSSDLTYNNDAKVYFNDNEVTSNFIITEENGNLTISCDDVKKFGATDNSVITVEYTATLNDKAVIGKPGNPNTVYLEYSNNPNWIPGGSNEPTGETPEDKVIVFTYTVVVNKVDQDNAPLTGAGFTLYKKTASGEWVAVGEELTGEALTTFEWKGLDDGDYKLSETTTPAGYNTIADIEFTITAEHDVTSDDPKLTKLNGVESTGKVILSGEHKANVDTAAGSLTTAVVNKQGATLPETGGMGTTMMYIGGGLLVAFAVIMLATKRRMNAAE